MFALLALAVTTFTSPLTAVRFDGNARIATVALRDVVSEHDGVRLAQTDEGLRSAGLFVLSAYFDRGFVDAEVTAERLRAEDGSMTLVFHVAEGSAYALGRVRVVGDTHGFAQHLPARGSAFSRSQIVAAIDELKQRYVDAGYAVPKVTPLSALDIAHRTIDVELDVAP